MTPIIFARRIALPSRLWFFHVNCVCARGMILPMSVTNSESSDEFWHSASGSMPSWWKTSVRRESAAEGPSRGLLYGGRILVRSLKVYENGFWNCGWRISRTSW